MIQILILFARRPIAIYLATVVQFMLRLIILVELTVRLRTVCDLGSEFDHETQCLRFELSVLMTLLILVQCYLTGAVKSDQPGRISMPLVLYPCHIRALDGLLQSKWSWSRTIMIYLLTPCQIECNDPAVQVPCLMLTFQKSHMVTFVTSSLVYLTKDEDRN